MNHISHPGFASWEGCDVTPEDLATDGRDPRPSAAWYAAPDPVGVSGPVRVLGVEEIVRRYPGRRLCWLTRDGSWMSA